MAYNNILNQNFSGIVARNNSGNSFGRTITGTNNQIIVTNGDGISANPTISLDPSIVTSSPVQSAATRNLNTIFQVSATRNSTVNYSIDISCSLSLLVGQAGTVYLEMSPSATFSSGIQEVCRFINSNTGALAVGLSLTQTNTARLFGFIPLAYYVRIRTENTTGTPSFLYRSGQEVVL